MRFRIDAETRGRGWQRSRPDRKSAVEIDPAAQPLWDALRSWRLEEARRQELPPYVIFHDSTLAEVARHRPVSLTALSHIPGIGRSKLERYGNMIIAIVAKSMNRAASPGMQRPPPSTNDGGTFIMSRAKNP